MPEHQSLSTFTARLEAGENLVAAEMKPVADLLFSPTVPESEKADFLSALRTKGETAEEIAGLAEALLTHAVLPEIDPARVHGPLLDVCGTGGDKLDLFNVSTTSMFVLAAGGAVVVKHGNRAITSQSGGADVLEALGVRIELSPAQLRECVYRLGLGFLFAPAFHPAFKVIGPVRKKLAAAGIPTVFNLLGPLLNPARPAHQLIGLFSRELLPKYAAAIALLPRRRVWAVHGAGMDELSTLAPNDVCDITPPEVRAGVIDPTTLGFDAPPLEALRGGDRETNAAILRAILAGEDRGPRRDMVVLNAAAGFVVCGLAADLPTGCALARAQLDSGGALAKLEQMRDFSVALR